LLDEIPDDPGHFIAVEFNNRVFDFDLCHAPCLFDEGIRVGVCLPEILAEGQIGMQLYTENIPSS
jgi:hypothetical protein